MFWFLLFKSNYRQKYQILIIYHGNYSKNTIKKRGENVKKRKKKLKLTKCQMKFSGSNLHFKWFICIWLRIFSHNLVSYYGILLWFYFQTRIKVLVCKCIDAIECLNHSFVSANLLFCLFSIFKETKKKPSSCK
jgi:hypothetical protein